METLEYSIDTAFIKDSFLWRYATKKFDPSKKLSQEQLQILLDAVRFAPTSLGLQAFKTFIITDIKVKEKLFEAANKQKQILDADAIFIFANYKNITSKQIDIYANNFIKTRNVEPDSIKGFIQSIYSNIAKMTEEQIQNWNAKQTYIALGFLLQTAATQKIDTCPMEGFDKQKFDEILNLETQNLQSSVIAAVGFRAEDDKYQFLNKVRKSESELFTFL